MHGIPMIVKMDVSDMENIPDSLEGIFIGGIINYGWSLQPNYVEQNGKQVLQYTKVFSMPMKPLLFCISLLSMPLVKR